MNTPQPDYEKLASEQYTTSEAYFIDQDLFISYVAKHVNPVRADEDLSTVNLDMARHLFDVIVSRRYRSSSA